MTRMVARAMFAAIAVVFALAAVVFVHIAAWYEIRVGLAQSYLATAGILGGIDLLLAIILALLASRSGPGAVEVEALEIRRKAIEGIGSALSVTRLIIPVVRLVADMRRPRRR